MILDIDSDILHRFRSVLPSGSRWQRGGGGRGSNETDWTILDCIYHEADDTYYALDLLAWKGFELFDCTAEFRLFFLRSKFSEELMPEVAKVSSKNEKRIIPLLYHDADPQGIRMAYSDRVPFIRDGLYFIIKQGYYNFGLSPLVLIWKDRACCRYLADGVKGPTSLVLKVGDELPEGGHALLTCEGVALGHVAREEALAHGIVAEDLLRFQITGAAEVPEVSFAHV